MGQPVMSEEGIVNQALLFKPTEEGLQILIDMEMQEIPTAEIPHKSEVNSQDEDDAVTEEEKILEPEETAPRKLAPPANGTDTIIGSTTDTDDLVIGLARE